MKLRIVAALAAGAVIVPAAFAHGTTAASTVKFKGKTSQRKSISFTYSKKSKRITKVIVGYHLSCPAGTASIDDRGSKFGTGTATVTHGRFTMKAPDASTLSGKVGTTTASGTLSLVVMMSNSMGQPVGNCTTGTVTWKASAPKPDDG